jgi:hypothetical protein
MTRIAQRGKHTYPHPGATYTVKHSGTAAFEPWVLSIDGIPYMRFRAQGLAQRQAGVFITMHDDREYKEARNAAAEATRAAQNLLDMKADQYATGVEVG